MFRFSHFHPLFQFWFPFLLVLIIIRLKFVIHHISHHAIHIGHIHLFLPHVLKQISIFRFCHLINWFFCHEIVVARVRDMGRYSCMIAVGGGKYVRHEVELLIYTVPEVGLETPFVFKVSENCVHTLHQMDDLMDNILDRLCGKINPVSKKRRSKYFLFRQIVRYLIDVLTNTKTACQYNVSLVCQPFRTYLTIMMESNGQSMPTEVRNVSMVMDRHQSHGKDKKLLRLPIVTTSSKPLPWSSVRKHRNRIKHDVNYLFTGIVPSRALLFENVLNYENKSINLSEFKEWAEWPDAESTGRGITFVEPLSSDFKSTSKNEQNSEHVNFTGDSPFNKTARVTAPTKATLESIIDSLEENMDEERRERLLSILKNVIVLDIGFNSTESTFHSESTERDFEILDTSTTAPQYSDILETTTPFLSDEVKELLKINKMYREDNSFQIAVMYLLKTPHPHFNPPSCSDQCMLELKIRHISWHSNAISDLIKFIMLSTKLPDSALLLAETVSKRKLTLFCLPGFSLIENMCVPCAPGSYNKAGFHSKCDPCPVDTYQDNYGSKVTKIIVFWLTLQTKVCEVPCFHNSDLK